jgi:hypothetical protein
LAELLSQLYDLRETGATSRGSLGESRRYGGDDVTIVAETAINSLLVSGPAERIAEIEVLVERLEAPPGQNSAATGAGTSRFRPRSESEGRAEFERLDLEAAQAAAEYHQATEGADDPNSEEQKEKLRAGLRDRVAAAFAARQALQRAELNELRERFDRIEQQIESRERIRDEIIDRRVDELLNPNLQWPTDDSPKAAPSIRGETPVSSIEAEVLERVQALEAAADAETSPQQKARLLQAAAAAYEQIYLKHRSQVLGLYARLYQARCLEKLGDDKQAQSIYSQLGWTPEEARAKLLLRPGMEVQGAVQSTDAAPEANAQARRRVEVARARMASLYDQYKVGEASVNQMAAAQADLLDAMLSLAQNAEERNAALRDHLAIMKDLLQTTQAQYQAGQATQADVLAVQAEILKIEQQIGRAADAGKDGSDTAAPGKTVAPSPRASSSSAFAAGGDLRVLEAKLTAAEQRLLSARAERQRAPTSQSAADVVAAQAEVEVARAELEQARREYETQEQLLELDLEAAQLRVEAAKAMWAEAETLRSRAPNAVSNESLRERQLAVQQAELEIRRAATLLEALRQKAPADEPQNEKPVAPPRR